MALDLGKPVILMVRNIINKYESDAIPYDMIKGYYDKNIEPTTTGTKGANLKAAIALYSIMREISKLEIDGIDKSNKDNKAPQIKQLIKIFDDAIDTNTNLKDDDKTSLAVIKFNIMDNLQILGIDLTEKAAQAPKPKPNVESKIEPKVDANIAKALNVFNKSYPSTQVLAAKRPNEMTLVQQYLVPFQQRIKAAHDEWQKSKDMQKLEYPQNLVDIYNNELSSSENPGALRGAIRGLLDQDNLILEMDDRLLLSGIASKILQDSRVFGNNPNPMFKQPKDGDQSQTPPSAAPKQE